ncbi:MAG: hypothetical protein KC912_12505 [Proteobacteria bacterium]|nr:hypothetical protein [Pseudomonadota bacterium]
MSESEQPESSHEGVAQRVVGFLKANWLGLVIAALWAAWLSTWPTLSRTESHEGRMMLSFVGALLTLSYFGFLRTSDRPTGPAHNLWRMVALLSIVYGSFNYYGFNKQWAEGFDDYTDITYYYLNSKYFDELGYTNLYEAMLLADLEGPKRVAPKIRTIRSLVTYKEVRAKQALAESTAKEEFSPERWASFKHDTDWFLSRRVQEHGIRGLQKNFFVDHGYNPPPTWTLFGGTLSNLVSVENMKGIASVDLVLVLLLFLAIGWVFGPDVALIAAVWYVATFSSRWPVLTHSLLRFDWVVALAGGVVALKARRHSLAGGLFAWSALSRIFPFIFGVPLIAKMGWDVYQTREVAPSTRKFLTGGVLTTVVLVLAAWAYTGTAGFVDGAENAVKHSSQYSSQKVGLGDALFFRGEVNRDEMRHQPCGPFERFVGSDCKEHDNIAGKGELIDLIETDLRVFGVLIILLVCAYAIRSKRPLHQLPALAVLPLFVLTNPSYYYYILRIVLVLFHAEDLKKRSNVVGLTWLFVMEVVSHWTKLQGYERYTTTATLSWMFIAYFLMVGWLLYTELPEEDTAEPAAG